MELITLIPAAGAGTRMRPLTHSVAKAMVNVAGKPILCHIIDIAINAGSKEFAIIVEYRAESIIKTMPEIYPDVKFHFIRQGEMKGLGHACYMAKDVCANKPLLIIYGDTLFKADLEKVVVSKIPLIGVKEIDDPRRFGIVELDASDKISGFVEKPQNPTTNLAIPGVNFFPDGNALFTAMKYILDNDIKLKGEYQITDAYQYMIKQGTEMGYFKLTAWYDCGKHQETIDTNKALLSEMGSDIKGELKNTQVTDPVIIPIGCIVEDSTVGPYMSMGINSSVKNSEIKNTIIGENSTVVDSNISDSLIGNRTLLKNVSGSMVLGDDVLINFKQ